MQIMNVSTYLHFLLFLFFSLIYNNKYPFACYLIYDSKWLNLGSLFLQLGCGCVFQFNTFTLIACCVALAKKKKCRIYQRSGRFFFKKWTSSPPPLPPDDDDVYAASLKCQMICANNQKLDLRPLKLKVFVFQVHDESCGATRDIALSVTNENWLEVKCLKFKETEILAASVYNV